MLEEHRKLKQNKKKERRSPQRFKRTSFHVIMLKWCIGAFTCREWDTVYQ
jgi:hypothetical protein